MKLDSVETQNTTDTSATLSIDVNDIYAKSATPGQGSISHDERYNLDSHKAEIKFANWLHSYYGGDIRLLSEAVEDGVLMPDFIWNEKLWD